jgi:GTP-binding protein
VEDFDTIQRELQLFDPAVAAKPQIVAANKIDALDDPTRLERLKRHVKAKKLKLIPVSGVRGNGLAELLEAAWRQIALARVARLKHEEPEPDAVDLLTPARRRRDA